MAGLLGTITGQVRLDIRQAVAAYATVRAQNAKTVYALRGTGEAFQKAGKTMMVGGAAFLAVFGKAVLMAAEFQRKMDFFQAVTASSAKQMQAVSNAAIDMSKNSVFSAQEIADGFVELGKAGVNAKGIIGGIGQAMINLGTAADIPLAEAGQTITSTLAQYQLGAGKAVHVTDLLAGAANASIADVTDIAYALKYVGGVANAVGVNLNDTVTAISLLAKSGIRGSTAGTSLRQMLVSLSGATKPATDEMQKLGIITKDGTNLFFTAAGKAKRLGDIFQILQNHTANLSQKERLAALRTIFNNRALASAAILTREGAKGFKQMYGEMSKVTAADVARKRMDNLSGDLKKLKANIDAVFIRNGSAVQDTMRGWVQALTRLVKAFGNLSPHTQKFILQAIGMTGVLLVAMGAFAYAVGTVFKFIVAMKRLREGMVFIRTAFFGAKIAEEGFAGILPIIAGALGITVGALLLVIAAVAAFIIIWVTAYKKIPIFRDAVNAWYGAIWNAIKAIGTFFKLLATNPSAVWDKISKGFQSLPGLIQSAMSRIPGIINKALSGLGGAAKGVGAGMFNTLISGVQQLPGLLMSGISRAVSAVGAGLKRLPALMIQLITHAVVWAATRMLLLGPLLASYVAKAVSAVFQALMKLPPRMAYIIGFAVGRAIRIFWNLGQGLGRLTVQTVAKVAAFLARLPGIIGRFVGNAVARGVSFMVRFATQLPSLAARAAGALISAIAHLPSAVAGIMARLVNSARQFLSRLPGIARTVASSMYRGFSSAIQGLPGVVSGIVGRMISAFTGAIGSAYNAAKATAGALWSGFKKGLGINSPSFIEKQMFQINDNLQSQGRLMMKHTERIQRHGLRLRNNLQTFASSSGVSAYRDLAMGQARSHQRSQSLLSASSRRSARDDASKRQPTGTRIAHGELDISPRGRAFIKGVAQDTYDDNEDYDFSIGRMR